jgi:hypothetical protein
MTTRQHKPAASKTKHRLQLLVCTLALCCLASFWSNPASAQRFVGKVIAGISANQIEGDKLVGFNQPGFFGGIGAAFPLSEEWGIEPQLLFSMKGSRSSEQEQLRFGVIQEIRLNYVELPIMLNYNLREDLTLQGGISPNVLLSASVDNGTNLGPENRRSEFKSYDLCVSLGAQYVVFDGFGVGIRWTYSMLPFNTVEDASNLSLVNNPLYGYTGMFNNSLQFSAMYLLFK